MLILINKRSYIYYLSNTLTKSPNHNRNFLFLHSYFNLYKRENYFIQSEWYPIRK